MAAITNTVSTFNRVGIREDLSNVIYDISPEETPFMSNIGRGTAKNTLHEWQTDSLASPDGANAYPQGDDISSFDAAAATTRIGNRTQISRKLVIVNGTIEAVDKAGRRSEKAYQTSKRSAELKRDMETILLSNQAAVAGSDPATAPKTGSFLAFLKTNTVKAGDGADPTYTTLPDDTRTDGTQAAFSEAMLKSALALAWNSGAKPRICMLGSFNKQAASAFTGIAQIRKAVEGASAATIIGAADVYVSDFGNVTFVPNRFMRARDVLLIDPEYAEVFYLRPFKTVPLAVTGDADKSMLIVEYGLKVHNEAAHAGIFDLTTS